MLSVKYCTIIVVISLAPFIMITSNTAIKYLQDISSFIYSFMLHFTLRFPLLNSTKGDRHILKSFHYLYFLQPECLTIDGKLNFQQNDFLCKFARILPIFSFCSFHSRDNFLKVSMCMDATERQKTKAHDFF